MNSPKIQLGSALPTTEERIAGSALVAVAIILVFAMLHHPVPHASSFEEYVAEVAALQVINRLVHGSAIGLMLVLGTSLSYFATRLGVNRMSIRLGAITILVGSLAMIAAALVSGFIVPGYLEGLELDSADAAAQGKDTLRAMREINRCCDLLGVICLSFGMFQCGIAGLLRRQKLWGVGFVGVVGGLAGIMGVFVGYTQANVTGVMVFSLLFASWLILAGASLMRGFGETSNH